MIKVKDGYAKLIGTTYAGSANRVLLSNGGDHVLGNANGNIPLSNGVVNTNLNADLLDGLHLSYIVNSNNKTDLSLENNAGYILHYTNISATTNTPYSIIGGNQCTVLQVLPGNSTYSAQFAIGFGSDYPAIRRRGDTTTWGAWNKISAGYADSAAVATALSQNTFNIGHDLNTIASESVYTHSNTTVCRSLINGPEGRSNGEVRLESVTCGSNSYGFQTLYTRVANNYEIWYRTWSNSDYTPWVKALHSGIAYISNGTITINGTSITPLTQQSLANYYTKTESDNRFYGATINRTANTVLAAPDGSAGVASFRKLVVADMPNGVFKHLGMENKASVWSWGTVSGTSAWDATASDRGYRGQYGTNLDISGFSTWYHRFAMCTDGRIEYWHGINTKTLTKLGTIAWTSDIPEIPNLSLGTTTGSGNAVTSISVSGHTITLNKGTTFLTSHQSLADCLRSTAWINNPGHNADAMAANTMGFTYANNAPNTGPIIYFAGTSGGYYGMLLNASYYGKSISFRTRNGDNGTWNSWDRLARAEEIPTKTSQLTNDSFVPLAGTTGLSGSIVMQGSSSTTPFIRNFTLNGTSGWAREIMDILVDGSSKFVIGAKGNYTKESSSNSIEYAYIGCNNFDGLNLKITAESLKWGTNTILHAGNSSVSGGGSTWGSSITVKVNGTEKTLTIPSIKTLTFSSGTFASKTYNGSADVTVYVPSNFNHIGDASNLYINAGTVTRRIIVQNTKNNLGYISRASIGLSNPADQFSPVIIGVGTNDAGTTYTDYYFHVGGSITDSKGNTYAKTSDIPTKTSQLDNDSNFITSRGYIGITPVQETSGNLALTGINNITTPLLGFTITTPSGNIQIGPQNTSECHIYTNRDLFYFNKPIYYWDGSSSHVYISEYNYTSYTPILNSSSTHATKSSVIYAPTTSGNGGDILISDGLGSAPVWTSPGNVTVGGAGKADKLTVARTIALSGAVTGSTSFDGSANITIATTMGSHTHSTYVRKAGDTMTGSLTLDGGANLYMTTTTSKLRIFAYSDSNYILSGNKDWNGNTPLYITGYNATQGSNLYLNFANIYCRSSGASYVNLDSGNWSTYIDVSKYLPLTGGTLYNSSNMNPLSINSASGESGIKFLIAYANKGWFGYNASYGVGIYNYTRGKYLNYKDDGTLLFEGNEVLHSGNWSNYITLPTTPSGGYIGTTAVSSSSNAGQNVTGVGDILPNATNSYDLGASDKYFYYVYANYVYGRYFKRLTDGDVYLAATNGRVDISCTHSSTYGRILLWNKGFTPTTNTNLGSSDYPWLYVYAKDYYVRGSAANTTAKLTSDAADNIYLTVGDIPMLVCDSTMKSVRSSMSYGGQIHLGTSNYRWNYVYANHLNAEGGSFYTDANGAYWTSDMRLKTNIIKARNLDIADLLVEFDWKESNEHSWGYIAQDLLEVLPEAVSYNADTDRYAVNYNVAHSAAIASLTARIKELEEKLKKYGIL